MQKRVKDGKEEQRRAKIEYFDKAHNTVLSQDIGIRIHGGRSVALSQKSFNLYAREEYDGNKSFAASLLGGNYSKIVLRNGGTSKGSVTKVIDVFNQSLVNDRAIGVQKYEPCVVFLNGEYWGLYNLQEVIGVDYIVQNYHVAPDNILLMKVQNANVEVEPGLSYDHMLTFAMSHNMSLDENFEYIESLMDVQSYIDFAASELYIANTDSVNNNNNYACWKTLKPEDNPYGDCRWRWLLYDTDNSLESADSDTISSWKNDALFTSLLKNETFKEQFVTSFLDIANNNFDYNRVSMLLRDISSEYKRGSVASRGRFLGDYSETTFDKYINEIDDFYKNRFDNASAHLKNYLSLKGELHSVTIETNNADAVTIAVNTIPSVENGWSGKYYSDYPTTVKCTVSKGYSFVEWTDGSGKTVSNEEEYVFTAANDITLKAIVRKK